MAKQSTTSKLKEAALKAKIEISDEIDRFIDKLDKAAADPEHSISMTEIENEWRQLSLSTNKTYSDFVSHGVSSLDTKELNKAKKEHLPQGRNSLKKHRQAF